MPREVLVEVTAISVQRKQSLGASYPVTSQVRVSDMTG